jgi:hypothetical protein
MQSCWRPLKKVPWQMNLWATWIYNEVDKGSKLSNLFLILAFFFLLCLSFDFDSSVVILSLQVSCIQMDISFDIVIFTYMF